MQVTQYMRIMRIKLVAFVISAGTVNFTVRSVVRFSDSVESTVRNSFNVN